MSHHSGEYNHASEDHAILYDVWQLIEWPEEKEILGGPTRDENEAGAITSNVKRLRSSMARWTWSTARAVGIPVKSGTPCSLPLDLIKLINSQGSWLFMLSHDGRFLAILQDNCLEVRSSKEDFNTTVGRCPISKDLYPQWRKLAWSQYDSTIAFSDSDGTVHVCDLKGILLFSFQEQIVQDDQVFDYSKAVSGLVFIGDEIAKQKETSLHLLIITYSGQVSCIDINSAYEMGYKVAFKYNFAQSYPNGVSSVVYDRAHSMIIVGGFAGYRDTAQGVPRATQSGLSAWRLVSDPPHLKFVELVSETSVRTKPSLLRRLSVMPSGIGQTLRGHSLEGISCIVLSPCGKHLAAIHLNGSLSLWEVPSLRHKRTWKQEEHPHFDEVNPEASKGLGSKKFKETLLNITDCKWWSDSALILARCSGSLTVVRCVENQLINLFGEQCEWMEPSPRVSSSRDEGFLSLECQTIVRTLKRQREEASVDQQNEDEQDADPFLDDSDSEERPGITGRLMDYTKSTVYDLTEIEYFRPPRKRPKLVTKCYRLISLSKTTPENLFERKLEAEEYGEALALAQKYNLDSDRVFQRQWRKSPVSLATIQDYLSKVSKLSWVLLECCERVPEELDAAKELLKFALIATDIDKLANAKTSSMQSISETSDVDSEDEEEYEGFDVEEQRRQEIRQRERFVRKWTEKVDFENLTLEQKEMIRTRRKVFKYQDRLSTYECLLGGYDAARERYNPKNFEIFRQQEMLTTAVERARVCNWRDVEMLLIYHGDELRDHRLPILSNFPKTLAPSEYEILLPEYDGQEVINVPEKSHRDIQDWCEEERFQHAITPLSNMGDPAAEFYQHNEILAQFRTDSPSLDCLRMWYKLQAIQMDLDARDIEGAISILKYGLEKGVSGLEDLLRDFKALDMLVYECGYDPGVTLTQLQEKTQVERLRMLLSQSSKEMYVKNIHRWAIPFLQMCDEEETGLGSSVFNLYVTSVAEEDLSLPELLFTSFIVDRSMPDFIANLASLIELAIEAVYLNSNPDQLDSVKKIHACLAKTNKSTVKAAALQERIDTLGRHVFVCKILRKYSVKVTPSHILEVEGDRLKVHKLFIRLSRTAGGKEPPLSKNEWNSLLSDMLQLREKIVVDGSSIESAVCLEVFVESLLTSGSISNLQIAGERMMRTAEEEHETSKRRLYTAPQKLSYESSVSLVVKSSQEYFDASTPNSNDNMLNLARECLLLITDQPSLIRDKLDLIEGVVLLQRFGVDKLPLQVRLQENRLKLIEMALECDDRSYRKTEQLLRLGKFLRVCGTNKDERTGKILTMIIDKALDYRDYQTAFCLCQELIAMSYIPGWIPCLRLAACGEFNDIAGKRSILSYVVCYCDGDKLKDVMDQMNVVDVLLIQSAIQTHEKGEVEPETELETNEVEGNGEDASTGNALNRLMTTTSSFLSPAKMMESTTKGTKAVLSATGTVLSATTTTTKAVLTNVGNTEWWKRTIDQTLSVLPGSEILPENKELDELLTNEDFEYQGCPLFYADVVENSISKYGMNLSTFAYHQTSEIALAQAKLRCIKLQKNDKQEIMDESSILEELVSKVLAYDFTLGLSYLLSMSNPERAFSVLQNFPISALSIQVSLYHYSLRFMLHYSSDALSPARASMYEIEPIKLIEKAVAIATNDKPTEEVSCVHGFVITLKEQLLDYAQGEKLQGLGRGIDLGRFTRDLEYREETILGLAMTSDEEQYKFAVSLAHRSGTDLWLVLVTHLEHLFTECQDEMDCAALHGHIKKLNMVPELVTRPTEFLQRMDRYVFPFISGQDHDRLHLYFLLINECKGDVQSFVSTHNLVSIPASNHIKTLKKIKSVTPDLDYKALITDDSELDHNPIERILNVLSPVLDVDSIQMLAKLVPKIPYSHHQVTSSFLYLQVAEKQCWKNVDQDASDGIDWIHNYESCSALLRMLNPQNLLNFFQNFLFLSETSALLSQKQRQDVIKRGIKLCKIQGTKERKKQLEEDVLSQGQSFQDVLPLFIQMSKHLDTYSTSFLSDMVKSANTDEKMANYLRLYDQTFLKPEEILNLASLMLSEGQSPFFIQNFLAVVPNKVCQPLDVLRKTIKDVTQQFNNQKNSKIFNTLSSLVRSISSHVKQNGKVMTSKQVIELLRPFCEDPTVDVQLRVDVLQLLEDQFEIEDSEAKLLLHHRTQALIRAGWGDKVLNDFTEKMENKETSIADEAGRAQVFDRLLGISGKDLGRMKHLVQLLVMWPDFKDANTENSSWIRVLTAMADLGVEGGKEILNVMRGNAQKISKGNMRVIFEKLMNRDLTFFAVKIVLLTDAKDLFAEIPEALKSVKCMGPSQCDEELLGLLLGSGMAPETVETLYYPRITEYLLSDNCVDAEIHVNKLARQLQDRGHMAEAGALLMNYRGMHPAFRTFSNAMSSLSRWLHS